MVLLVLLASEIMADNSGLYIGLYGGETQLKVKVSNGTSFTDKEKTGKNGELKIGYYFNDHHRINAFYQNSKPVSDADGTMYGLNYDYLMGSGSLKPYAGIMAGHFKVTYSGKELKDDFVGAQAGLNYIFWENFSLEAGYRYIIPDGDPQSVGPYRLEADRINNWYAGVNYQF